MGIAVLNIDNDSAKVLNPDSATTHELWGDWDAAILNSKFQIQKKLYFTNHNNLAKNEKAFSLTKISEQEFVDSIASRCSKSFFIDKAIFFLYPWAKLKTQEIRTEVLCEQLGTELPIIASLTGKQLLNISNTPKNIHTIPYLWGINKEIIKADSTYKVLLTTSAVWALGDLDKLCVIDTPIINYVRFKHDSKIQEKYFQNKRISLRKNYNTP